MLKKCPYCGRVLPVRRRLPNGFGQICEIKNKNLAKPFRAMVTVGRKENGRAVCRLLKPVAYFETYEEAYAALEEYHRRAGITLRELFWTWFAEWSESAKYPQDALVAWNYCLSLHGRRINEISESDLRVCVDECFVEFDGRKRFPSPVEKARIRHLFQLMFKFAAERGLMNLEN